MITFSFENSMYLWLLFSIPLFIVSHFVFLKRSKSRALNFANIETIRRISGDKIFTKNMTHLILRIIIIFCLILAAAGTKLWYFGQVSTTNYVIALDSSASMTAEDITPSRFLAAKNYINRFVDSLSARTKLGLVTFAGTSIIEQQLTESKVQFKLALQRTSISVTGGTDVAGAIITSTNLLMIDSENGRTIILISDGLSNVGAFIHDSVRHAVNYAKNNQVIIHTIAVGTDSGPLGYLPQYYNISLGFDEEGMRFISDETNGKYIYASTTNELVQALDFLSENTTEAYVSVNISFLALLIGLSLLFVEWGLANTIYRRLL